jgi:hypothetical protein
MRYKGRERGSSVLYLIKHGLSSVLNGLENDPSKEFIGEVLLKLNVV